MPSGATREQQRQQLAETLAEFIGEVSASLTRVEAALRTEFVDPKERERALRLVRKEGDDA